MFLPLLAKLLAGEALPLVDRSAIQRAFRCWLVLFSERYKQGVLGYRQKDAALDVGLFGREREYALCLVTCETQKELSSCRL
jgi:hypothetical protein